MICLVPLEPIFEQCIHKPFAGRDVACKIFLCRYQSDSRRIFHSITSYSSLRFGCMIRQRSGRMEFRSSIIFIPVMVSNHLYRHMCDQIQRFSASTLRFGSSSVVWCYVKFDCIAITREAILRWWIHLHTRGCAGKALKQNTNVTASEGILHCGFHLFYHETNHETPKCYSLPISGQPPYLNDAFPYRGFQLRHEWGFGPSYTKIETKLRYRTWKFVSQENRMWLPKVSCFVTRTEIKETFRGKRRPANSIMKIL